MQTRAHTGAHHHPYEHTSQEHRLKENIGLFDFLLTPDEMAQISSLNIHRRFNDPGVFADIPIYD